MTHHIAFILRTASLGVYAFALILLWTLWDISELQAWLQMYVAGEAVQAASAYVLLVALLTALAVPRQICSFVGGYVFGLWEGTLLATLGTAISCSACFFYARFVGQSCLHARWGHKLSLFNDFLCQSPFILTLVVRIIPLGSNFLTNFLAGISRIPAAAFLGGSAVGFTAQNFVFALMGSGITMEGSHYTLYSMALYALSLSLGLWIYRRYKKQSLISKKTD